MSLQVQHHPSVFISYCWSNSRDAQSRGTKCSPEALGWGDPREIKRELEKRGVSCWMDIDQPASVIMMSFILSFLTQFYFMSNTIVQC